MCQCSSSMSTSKIAEMSPSRSLPVSGVRVCVPLVDADSATDESPSDAHLLDVAATLQPFLDVCDEVRLVTHMRSLGGPPRNEPDCQ
jgi:hypothetical protein